MESFHSVLDTREEKYYKVFYQKKQKQKNNIQPSQKNPALTDFMSGSPCYTILVKESFGRQARIIFFMLFYEDCTLFDKDKRKKIAIYLFPLYKKIKRTLWFLICVQLNLLY